MAFAFRSPDDQSENVVRYNPMVIDGLLYEPIGFTSPPMFAMPPGAKPFGQTNGAGVLWIVPVESDRAINPGFRIVG